MNVEEMVRVKCEKCGFDGYSRFDVGHQCMRMVPLALWEQMSEALKEALDGWDYVLAHWNRVDQDDDLERIEELRKLLPVKLP